MPKALIEVAGEPFIAHQLRLLRREGIRHVVLCLGFLGKMVREAIGGGERYGLTVVYSFDGDKLLGTGGALKRALSQLGERFFVLYGDSYLDIAYRPVYTAFRRSGAPALMTVFRNEGRWDASNVLFDGAYVVRYDKRNSNKDMDYIDYGLGLFARKTIADWPEEAFDLADVYAKLAEQGRLAGYEVSRRFYEIGTLNGLAETDAYLREAK
jgi:NDP-sugar pyrophosphorylase family protein